MRSEARRGEQGQSGGRRKRFAPQVSHALQAGRSGLSMNLPGWGLVIVESSTGERGESLLCRGPHCPGVRQSGKGWEESRDRPGGGNRGKSGDDGSAFKVALRSLCV